MQILVMIFFIIRLTPELLPVFGPLERWCDTYTSRGGGVSLRLTAKSL